MLDPAGAMGTFDDVLRVGRACDEARYMWLEDPFRGGGLSQFAHRKLKDFIKTPLLMGEHIRGLEAMSDMIESGAADYVRASARRGRRHHRGDEDRRAGRGATGWTWSCTAGGWPTGTAWPPSATPTTTSWAACTPGCATPRPRSTPTGAGWTSWRTWTRRGTWPCPTGPASASPGLGLHQRAQDRRDGLRVRAIRPRAAPCANSLGPRARDATGDVADWLGGAPRDRALASVDVSDRYPVSRT